MKWEIDIPLLFPMIHLLNYKIYSEYLVLKTKNYFTTYTRAKGIN